MTCPRGPTASESAKVWVPIWAPTSITVEPTGIFSFMSFARWPSQEIPFLNRSLISLVSLTFLSRAEHLPTMIYWLYSSFGLVTILIFYGLYRCAYLKPGSRFLTFYMIVGSLLTVKATVDSLRAGHSYTSLFAL